MDIETWELVHSLLNVTNNLSTVTLFNVCQVLGITKLPFLLMCVGSFWVAYIVYSHFLYFLSWQVFSDFCRSIGVTSIRSVRVAHGLCIITLVHCFLSLFSHTPHSPYPSLVFRSPSSSLSPFPSTPPPSHSFPLTPPRQYEEKQLKGQQERAQRRLEFANQESRLQNQLAYERQRDTMGMCSHESHVFNLHVIE